MNFTVRTLEKTKATGNFAVESSELNLDENNFDNSDSSSSDSEIDMVPRHKKIKIKKL